MRFGIADDGITQRTPELAAEVVPEWKATGMDAARVLVIWSYVAPGSDRTDAARRLRPVEPERPAVQLGARSTRSSTC